MIRIGDNAILESGTSTFIEGQEYSQLISLSKSDSSFEPIITAIPVSETGGVNVHLDTTVEFNNSTKKWQFIIHRSIGANTNNDVGAEAMTVIWKAICLKNIRQVGGTVTVANEPH